MEFELYDSNKETFYDYLKRVEKFNLSIKKDKYDILLQFFNKLLNTKYKTFREISIPNDIFISKLSEICEIIDEYRQTFESWGIKTPIFIDFKHDNTSQITFEENILDVFKKLLSIIGYSIYKKNNANGMFVYKFIAS